MFMEQEDTHHPRQGIPLGKQSGRGRPISRETKLGRLLSDRELRSYSVAASAGISPRYLTEYCAGRRAFTQDHVLSLCRVLGVTPDMILEDVEDDYEDEVTQLTDADTSTGGLHQTRTVEDLQRQQHNTFGPTLPRVSRLRKVQE